MKRLLSIALLVAQAGPVREPASSPPPAEKPPVAPWKGTLAEGLREMRKLSDAGKPDDALEVAERILTPGAFAKWREEATAKPGWKRTVVEGADPVLAAVGLSDLSPAERATVHFARGVVLAHAEKRGEAGEAFEKARALAGPGELRLDATYDLGWTALAEGETLRKQIPELGGTPPLPSGQPGQPPPPAQPTTPQAQLQQQMQGQMPQGPDPLQLARAAYTLARDRFVERLKADARDPDSRANVELAQKRLKELAEIQKKRDEEKQKQEQQKKDQQQKDQDQKNQDKKDEDQQKKDDAKDPNKDQKSDEQKKKEEEQKKEQEDQKKKEQEKKDAKPDASKDELLTKEEIMRLLDTLKDREEEGKKLMERLKRANRAKVKKDW